MGLLQRQRVGARSAVARRVRARLQALADAGPCARGQCDRAAPRDRAHHAQHEAQGAPRARSKRLPRPLHADARRRPADGLWDIRPQGPLARSCQNRRRRG